MTALQHPDVHLASRLSEADLDAVARALDDIRQGVLDSRGAADAAYIRRVIRAQQALDLGGRLLVVLAGGRSRTAWAVGTTALALGKVLDNMEIGHNVLHGQWDWMRDPRIHSGTWDWDHVSPPSQWQRAHNVTHHTYTNVLGHDDDLGYGILRVDEEQPWEPRHLAQPFYNLLNALAFEYGIAAYDLGLGEALRSGRGLDETQRGELREVLRRAASRVAKDVVVLPLVTALVGAPRPRRGLRAGLAAGLVANLARNLWSHSVIMCGHFPEGVQTFTAERLPPEESRGEWYLRQMLGSANISGSPLLHLLAGNLSHQIEHHLFPDLPSNRYQQIAPAVRAVFDEHGLRYHSAPLWRQVASAWHKVVRLSVPDGGWREAVRATTAGARSRARRARGRTAPAGG
jgi:fatty acid desaturase